jgi:hypothetical protein
MTEAVNPEIIKRRLWLDYQKANSDPANDRMDCLQELMNELVNPEITLHDFLQSAANTIGSKLCINEVTIGLRNPQDGLYEYHVMFGLEPSEWEAHQKLSYSRDQFDSQGTYKFKELSKHTRLFLVEDNPYGEDEEETYSKELMLKSKRNSIDDAIEGDYLDTLVLGKKDDLLGWIEYSGMTNGKFPDGQAIMSMELIATMIAVAINLLGPCET